MAREHKQSVHFGETGKLYCHMNKNGRKQYRKDVGVVDENYENVDLPAHKAALEGNLSALQNVFIWKNSTGIPALDIYGATPLHMAARRNHADIIKWLLRYSDLSVLDQAHESETPVHVAAALGHAESVKALLETKEKDAKLLLCGITDSQGFTPLLLAIRKHKNDAAKILLSELGSKAVHGFSVSGINAAHMAASAGNVEILKLLYSKYKNILNLQSVDGATPIYFAAQEGQIEALSYLIDVANCDLSMPNNDGLKPIHAAAQAGHTSIVKLIIKKTGVNAIIERGPDGATPLHFAASAGVMRTAKWIVNCDSSGYLIGVTDNNGDTPAHDAAENKQVEMLAFLLDCGADLYATNKAGQSPYSNALSKGDPELSNVIMMFSADKPESEGISEQKHHTHKRTRNDLSDQELTDKILAEEAEMGLQPTFRSNPVSRTAATPPPTPATTQDGDDDFDLPFLAIVENPYSMYSSINPEVVAKKRQTRQRIVPDTELQVPLQTFKGEETPKFAGQRPGWSPKEVPTTNVPPEAGKVHDQELQEEETKEVIAPAEKDDSDTTSTASTDDDKEALIIS